MDKNMLLEMAKLIAIQQTEIGRLKSMVPSNKKSKRKIDNETKQRRISLIAKMYQKQWKKTLVQNSEKISPLNQQLMITGLSSFKPHLEIEKILKPFK